MIEQKSAEVIVAKRSSYAAMAERAECVMLNKGPFIAEAVTILDDVLTRTETHQLKKSPQLRALRSW
jgi:pyruvate kinase